MRWRGLGLRLENILVSKRHRRKHMATLIRRRRLGRSSCKGIKEASEGKIGVCRNDWKKLPEDDLYIRWGCTTNIPCKNVLNTAKAIHEVNDKAGFRRKLNEAELCPPTFFEVGAVPNEYVESGMITRPATHSRGRHCYVSYNFMDLVGDARSAGVGYYTSLFIRKVAEYRVFIVQGRVVTVAEKTPGNPDDIAWNVAEGGKFTVVAWDKWPLKAVRTSVEAFNLSSLDFGGVDVMVAEDGSCYVLEINSAPSLTSPYRQQCMAKAFMWIMEHGKERIELIEEKGGYLKFIHPAICDRAKL